MLHRLQLDDWKSFGTGDSARNIVEFAPLTLLVGPNASGKSNVLDALRFLQGAALGYPLYDVLRGRWEGGREVWTAIRGGEAEAGRVGASTFTLGSQWSRDSATVKHSIRVHTVHDVAVDAESLHDDAANYYFDTHAPAVRQSAGRQPGGGIKVALRCKGKGNSETQEAKSASSLLGQVEQRGRVDHHVIDRAKDLRSLMREAVFFDLQPRLMRQPSPLGAVALGIGGENLAAVLHGMSDDTRADLVDWLSELCAPRLTRIDFAEVAAVREVFFLLVEAGSSKISSRSASDGTLRFLGILAALLTCPEKSLVVFEEPDVGLHPARVHLLAELLEQITSKRGIQVIATTHSPVLLAHLSKEAFGNVVAFDRDPVTGLTVCSRVSAMSSADQLLAVENREHLIATGWLERAL
jgi:predicted ATPase